MKSRIIRGLLAAGLLMLPVVIFAQETEDKPVRSTFETNTLIDNETTETMYMGMLQLNIQHRFGSMENGISDLFGIYGSANTRLNLNYGITDRIMIGFGTTQGSKLQDLQWKYAILKQTQSGSIPVSLVYFGNVVLDARADEYFGTEETYNFIHRLSYFHQFIVARKFSEKISAQVAPTLAYYNAVDPGVTNIHLGIHAGARAKISMSGAILLEYDQSFTSFDAFDNKPSLSFGYEIGTSTHAFQVFATNYRNIVYQKNFVYNTNDLTRGEFIMGFNITVRF